jgi:hypothetical protein
MKGWLGSLGMNFSTQVQVHNLAHICSYFHISIGRLINAILLMVGKVINSDAVGGFMNFDILWLTHPKVLMQRLA